METFYLKNYEIFSKLTVDFAIFNALAIGLTIFNAFFTEEILMENFIFCAVINKKELQEI